LGEILRLMMQSVACIIQLQIALVRMIGCQIPSIAGLIGNQEVEVKSMPQDRQGYWQVVFGVL
jgi:hypothetical protein